MVTEVNILIYIIITLFCAKNKRLLGHFTGKWPLHWKHVSHFTGKCNFIENDIQANNPLHRKTQLH